MPQNPELLHRLCESVGIYHGFHDLSGAYIQASDETKLAQLAAMNMRVEDEGDLDRIIHETDASHTSFLPPSLVLPNSASVSIPVRLPASVGASAATWRITPEHGDVLSGTGNLVPQPGEVRIGTQSYRDFTLVMEGELPLGYHQLALTIAGETTDCFLILVPKQTQDLSELGTDARIWGVTAPLYGLKSARNWGIGDFEDLALLAENAAKVGAHFVGINPVHALFPAAPDMYSPYSPSSREFLNIMHIAPDQIPELTGTKAARAKLATLMASPDFAAARNADLLDYKAVYSLKTKAFALAYSNFSKLKESGSRGMAFAAFVARKGEALWRHALYEVIFELEQAKNPTARGWQDWPPALQDPSSAAVTKIGKTHAARVRYYMYLQWIAHEQIASAQARALRAGMRIGLYLDLAVGMVPGGAEAWSEKAAIATGMSMGAPGDAANPDGQKWHLAPFDPITLKKTGYAIFRKTLSNVMHHAGLVRIDHILGINRAFWCPLEGNAPGNYVSYPREDMLGIIALESVRNQCAVVGEDLGTVPDGFRERLDAWGLMGCALAFFEREGDSFTPSAHYGRDRMTSITNHDFPTLKGWWEEEDFIWRAALGIGTDGGRLDADRGARFHDRWLMLKRLEAEGLLPDGISPNAAPGTMSPALGAAIHRFLARTPATLVAVPLEDILGLKDQPNVPGTTTEQPNWRRKLPTSIETLFDGTQAQTILAAIRAERPSSPAKEI